jgi:hypothetical protein
MADAGPSLHRYESGSSLIFAYAALTHYWAFLSGVASAAHPQPHGHPHWLLGVIHALVNLGVLPLVAICLLLISGHRYPPIAT